jgi:hypothetical protein
VRIAARAPAGAGASIAAASRQTEITCRTSAGHLPGQRKPVGKAFTHPVGGKFVRQEQIECPGFLADRAKLDRLDPLAVQLLAQIFAQTLADISPVRREVHGLLLLAHRA